MLYSDKRLSLIFLPFVIPLPILLSVLLDGDAQIKPDYALVVDLSIFFLPQ